MGIDKSMTKSHVIIGRVSSAPITLVAVSVLLTLALLGFYFQIKIGLPFALYYFCGFTIFILTIPRPEDVRLTLALSVITFFSFSWIAFSSNLAQYFPEQFLSYSQLLLAILASIGVFRALNIFRDSTISSLAFWVFVMMSIGIFLEVMGPLRPFSDTVRHAIYDNGVYSNDIRDVRDYGWVRPKLFSSEPSHLAKFYGLVILTTVASLSTLRRQIWCIVTCIPIIILINSPAVIAGLLSALGIVIIRIGVRRILLNPFVLIIVVVLFGVMFYMFISSIQTRLIMKLDPSVYLRLLRPIEIASYTIQQRPLLGYGIGSDNQIAWLFNEVSFGEGAPEFIRRDEMGATNRVWGASHFALVIQLGLVGSILWIFVIGRFMKIFLLSYRPIFWLYFVLFGLFVGVINTPFYWGQLFIALAALKRAEKHSLDSNIKCNG